MEDKGIVLLESILAGTQEPRELPLEIFERITDRFSKHREIGGGGFGVVYKGNLSDDKIVAVKKIFFDIKRVNDKHFIGEVTSLLKVNHPNVIRFLGFCSSTDLKKVIKDDGSRAFYLAEERERLLCFEYVSNGSLDKHITDELRGLGWNTRYEIIMGICKGLQYLHQEEGIIHMDLKPANIMVDSGMVPKITDFGLSRPEEISHTTGDRFGTRGYWAPEYTNEGITNSMCDIYSLGVIIIELVTGRKGNTDVKCVLRRWRHTWNNIPTLIPLQDQRVNECQITKCIEIAKRCMDDEPAARPSISEVTQSLDGIRNINCHIPGKISPWVDDMLRIEPLDLHIAFEPNKEISCEVELTNRTRNCMAFNIEMSNMYRTVPEKGIVELNSKRTVQITLKAQEMIPEKHHPDENIVKSVKVEDGVTDDNVSQCMFRTNNEAGKVVDEVNFRVVYIEKKKLEQSLELLSQPNAPSTKDIKYINCKHVQGQGTYRLNFHPLQIALVTNENCRYETSDRAVDLMTGAMGSLLPKLRELIKKEEHNLQSVKQDVESLMDQLMDMHTALCNVSQEQLDQLGPQDKRWANKVRELSYDLEDMVDNLLVSIEHSEPITNQDGFWGLIRKMINLFEWGRTPYHIAHVIKDIIIRVKESKLEPSLTNNKHNQAVTWTCDRLSALYNKDLFGIDVPRDKIADMLINGSGVGSSTQKLKIISIFGAGGLGKTTLAKAVYDILPPRDFVRKAFVSVGRNPDIKQVLEDILLELDNKEYGDIRNKRWNEKNLIDELQDVLNNKRYLIVIDDLWDIPSWEKIKYALRDDGCGSRIITTSRISHVAQRSGEVCELEPLCSNDSKKLFNAVIKSRKGTCTFGQPEEESTKYILEKCAGVPLAIITIASLLSTKETKDWPKVYNSIGFGNEHNTDIDNTRKILLYSFYDLPWHLKTCLLHLSTFPEDREIEKNTLVWRWVAEGFVHAVTSKTLFEVGEMYFNELVNRSLLQPVEGTAYTIHVCRIHDMVLDMICSVVKDYNFVSTILDSHDEQHSSSYHSNTRRLSVRKKIVKQGDLDNTCREKVRSLNATPGCLIFDLMSSLPSYEALRVLSIDYCELIGDKPHENLAGLHHLRYLGLSGTNIGELPVELGKLRFLLTLDLRGTAVKALPQSVTLLIRLKCLLSEGSEMRLPEGMGNLTSLEELRLDNVFYSPNFVTELGKLTELRKLRIGTFMFGDSLNKALVESLSRLKKIEELELCDDGRCKMPNWEGFTPSQQLRHLRLHNIRYSRGLPAWIHPDFLPRLSHLNVSIKSAEAKDLDILGNFPDLGSLCLFIAGQKIFFPDAIAAGKFPKLQYHYMFAPLKYQPGAMPCLQSVEFHVDVKAICDAKMGINLDSLEYLPLLVRVHANIIRWDVTVQEAEAAETAVRRAVDKHINCPMLVLEHVGSCTDEFEFNSRHSNLENAIMSKLRSRIIQAQGQAEESDSEQIDPTDEEVISRDSSFKEALPSIIASVFDEILNEGRQREAEESDSEQIDSKDEEINSSSPNIEEIWAKFFLLLALDEGRQDEAEASNSKQTDSTDEELLQQQQLRFQADTPTVVRQQQYRFPVVKPIGER